MPFTPDPISIPFERAAGRVLDRTVAKRGEWFGTRIADPTMRQTLRALADWGIRVEGRDTATGRAARTRWMRAFIRALERERKAAGVTITWEVGRHLPRRGVIPAGRAVRVRTQRGGGRAMQAVDRKPLRERIYDDEGQPAGRYAHPELRDWGEAGNA